MWFSSTDSIDYDIFVGDLLSKEMRIISSKETSTTEAMVVRGRSIERGKIREVHQGLTQKERIVNKNVGSVENKGISRRIVRKDRMHPKRTPQKKKRKIIYLKQVQVPFQVWLMRYCLLLICHINISTGCYILVHPTTCVFIEIGSQLTNLLWWCCFYGK
jgi:hypothetical protein